ncbi:MAG TPA: Bcr/CflA family efflux MFS transporter [Methylophaga aminisulfidivorans]|nr:Bcr/CflA family efflux MFS transporter [Methylophaga aminisulfidivorans]
MKNTLVPTPTLILLLAALMAMTPLAIDAYLPAIPTMADYFNVSVHDTEISLSVFLAGFALGQIIGGPFSDHFGRRASVGTGLSLFCIGTLGILFSPDMHTLWGFRVLEAFGGGLAAVNSSAVIRDLSQGSDSAKHLSNIAIVMMLAPLLAPLIGMGLLFISGWKLIFIFLLTYGLLIGSVLFFRLPETRKISNVRTNAYQRYRMVVTHRYALGFIFSQCLAMGGMFAFITGSPSVFMGYFGVSETLYPFLFGANVLGMMIINRINNRLLKSNKPAHLLSVGQTLQVTSGLLLLLYVSLFSTLSLWVLIPLMISFIGSMGFIASNSMSSTIEFFPHNSATATALIGAMGFATGALSGFLVGLWGDGTPLPMAVVMFICALAGPTLRALMQFGQQVPAQ